MMSYGMLKRQLQWVFYCALLLETVSEKEEDCRGDTSYVCQLGPCAGQMLSIQDENVLPPQFSAALEKVRAGAVPEQSVGSSSTHVHKHVIA
jgi:hypothetical protein